jgi:hypothetical protein
MGQTKKAIDKTSDFVHVLRIRGIREQMMTPGFGQDCDCVGAIHAGNH